MPTRTIRIRIELNRRQVVAALAAAALAGSVAELASEQITLSTTYPSPSGIYAQIITTGAGSKNTVLARDGGRVGIGTTSPGAKLHVSGGVTVDTALSVGGDVTVSGLAKLGAAASDPGIGANGSLYYNTGSNRVRVQKGGAWADLAGSIGWEIIRVPNGENFSSAMAFCSPGKTIIGGGCGNYGSDQTTTKKLVWSMPLASNNGWVCYYDLAMPANKVSAMAICANVSP